MLILYKIGIKYFILNLYDLMFLNATGMRRVVFKYGTDHEQSLGLVKNSGGLFRRFGSGSCRWVVRRGS